MTLPPGGHIVSAAAARGTIAASLLAPPAEVMSGHVTLWAHQRDAVARLRAAIAELGGALLADEVGLGKSHVALAVARQYTAPLLVAPASLRGTWQRTMEIAGVCPVFLSVESLGRRPPGGAVVAANHDFLIVDEAHHARNPLTARYRSLVRLARGVPVLLLTATPIHNSRRDLEALLALFMGARARAADAALLARCIMRRSQSEVRLDRALPSLAGPHSIAIPDDSAIVALLVALPAPVPAADEDSAEALLRITLLRQWSSSEAALRGALRRRMSRTRALSASVADGRVPTRSELDAWTLGDDAQQLALALLLAPHAHEPPAVHEAVALLGTLARHEGALRALLDALDARPDRDRERADALAAIRRRHDGARVLAFTQFAETARAHWRHSRNVPGTCVLTAHGARVAGGAISRREALARFAPVSSGAPRPRAAEDIRCLIATDILSEGVNLQDASVIVHLDLPWTAARVEQRVGRLARLGSPHATVTVYTMSAPDASAALLNIEERLRGKLRTAGAEVGVSSLDILGVPRQSSGTESQAPPAAAARLEATLRGWHDCPRGQPGTGSDGMPAIAGVSSTSVGWIALLRDGALARLVASLPGRLGADPRLVADACAAAAGDDAPISAAEIDAALGQLEQWVDRERGARAAGALDVALAGARRSALSRIAAAVHAPRASRGGLSALAGKARTVAAGPLDQAGEEELRQSLDARFGDPEWLRTVAALDSRRSHRRDAESPGDEALEVLLILVPCSHPDAALRSTGF